MCRIAKDVISGWLFMIQMARSLEERIISRLSNNQKMMLLLLDADNNAPLHGKLWLQKLIFLLANQDEDLKNETSFEPDLMGPYSETVEQELEQLILVSVVEITSDSRIRLTELGLRITSIIKKEMPTMILSVVSDFKKFLNYLSRDELLAYIYSAHPDMTSQSVKFNEIMSRKEELLMKLVIDENISMSRASELLNKDKYYVMKKLREKGVKIYSE